MPRARGVYAWYFAETPPGIDTNGCFRLADMTLLYVGISPREPPANGRPASRSTLRQRLRTHYAGNAAGSTLRRTLGCLLSERIGIELRRVGSGSRHTFTNPGEQRLDRWMAENAFVVWREVAKPWEAERSILKSGLPFPLNVRDNPSAELAAVVQQVRRIALGRANELPIIANSGGSGRSARSHKLRR